MTITIYKSHCIYLLYGFKSKFSKPLNYVFYMYLQYKHYRYFCNHENKKIIEVLNNGRCFEKKKKTPLYIVC